MDNRKFEKIMNVLRTIKVLCLFILAFTVFTLLSVKDIYSNYFKTAGHNSISTTDNTVCDVHKLNYNNNIIRPIALSDDVDIFDLSKSKTSNQKYNFSNLSKREEIIEEILEICIENKSPKICDLVYADLVLRTHDVANTIEDLSYKLSEELDLYVDIQYEDETDLTNSIYEYVVTLDKIANTGLRNNFCLTVAKTTFSMLANERGVIIQNPIQNKLREAYAHKACGNGVMNNFNFEAYNVDPNDITIQDITRCEVTGDC